MGTINYIEPEDSGLFLASPALIMVASFDAIFIFHISLRIKIIKQL